jgi:RNA polymerase sigma-70 factor (ECF subfamily)
VTATAAASHTDDAAAVGSNADGFEEFVRASRHRLRSHLVALTGGRRPDVVEDLLAETYARAWQQWPQLVGYTQPQAWLHTVAWRLAATRWRTASRRAEVLTRWAPDLARGIAAEVTADVHAGPPGSYLTDDATLDRIVVADAMRGLPADQQRLLCAYYWNGLPVRELADSLGVPAGTVKARLVRARTALAVALAERDADPFARRPPGRTARNMHTARGYKGLARPRPDRPATRDSRPAPREET